MTTAIILPACNEAACLPAVLAELLPVARSLGCVVAVGLNDCSDDSEAVMREFPEVLVGRTTVRGYGQGCMVAMQAADALFAPDAYVFLAADGANDPALLSRFLAAHSAGADLVLGQRTLLPANWLELGAARVACNLLLGAWAGILAGTGYADLGPYRLISARLMRAWQAMEPDGAWGWTIEPQVLAPFLKLKVESFAVYERPRIAGEQKVTGVSLRHSWRIGKAIFTSAWRMWQRAHAAPGLVLRRAMAR
jgi:glycosyltransferase involved in cell wall biosynthesis